MSSSQSQNPDPQALRPLGEVLLDIEHALRASVRHRAERSGAPVAPPAADLDRLAAELEACVSRAPEEAARHARRVRHARARLALHARGIPDGALEGLYEDVRAATDHASPWERSRMSDAFLDAPRELARWRGAALAACAVLALGAGLFAGGRLGFEDRGGPQGLERSDPRNALLPRLESMGMTPAEATATPGARRDTGTLVSDPGALDRGERGFAGSRRARSFYVFYGSPQRPGDASRRLDAVSLRVFPVGAPVDDVEQN